MCYLIKKIRMFRKLLSFKSKNTSQKEGKDSDINSESGTSMPHPQSENNSLTSREKMGVRIRIATINRHLYLIGPLYDYLRGFYEKNEEELAQATRDFYLGTVLEKEALAALEKLDFNDKEERFKFIDEWFTKPISYFFLAVMISQHKRWEDYNKGKIDEKSARKYPPFRDQDLRRFLEFVKSLS